MPAALSLSLTPPDLDESIRIETRFGTIEARTRDLLHFPGGLPGFEKCRRFALLALPELSPLFYLHAVDGPPASFLGIDPLLVLPNYRQNLRPEDRARLGEDADPRSLVWLALVSVDRDDAAWVNLGAPVVINPARMIGCQVVPHDAVYPLRHPLTLAQEEIS